MTDIRNFGIARREQLVEHRAGGQQQGVVVGTSYDAQGNFFGSCGEMEP